MSETEFVILSVVAGLVVGGIVATFLWFVVIPAMPSPAQREPDVFEMIWRTERIKGELAKLRMMCDAKDAQDSEQLDRQFDRLKKILEADNNALEILKNVPKITAMSWSQIQTLDLDAAARQALKTMLDARTRDGATDAPGKDSE